MNTIEHTHGRISPASFFVRFMPLVEIELDPANEGAPYGSLRFSTRAGIQLAAYPSGVFAFDCTGWEPGSPVELPSLPLEGMRLPRAYIAADDKAFQHVVSRVRMANCFLACMSDAISRVQRTSLHLEQIVDPGSYLPFGLNDGRQPCELPAPEVEGTMRQLRKPRPPGSPSIKLSAATIKHAIEKLDVVLQDAGLTRLVEQYYQSCYQYARHDNALAATIAWTVCEKTLNHLWSQHLRHVGAAAESPGRMNRERRDRLQGLDFTASIVTEALELLGVLDFDLYKDLNTVRGVRNKWMHRLAEVTSPQASQGIHTAYKMLKRTYEVDLLVQRSTVKRY